jgi:hypothetical protein
MLNAGKPVTGASEPPSSPEKIVKRYLFAKTREAALALLAPDYRLWFEKRDGKGLSKSDVAELLAWDYALHPRHRITDLQINVNEVVANVHEDNDFSLLIGFPGWDAVTTYRVNEGGFITEQFYVPRPGQVNWKPYLEKALPWLLEHRAVELSRIYPNKRLRQTAESAKEWVKVLRDWRRHSGQDDPTRR